MSGFWGYLFLANFLIAICKVVLLAVKATALEWRKKYSPMPHPNMTWIIFLSLPGGIVWRRKWGIWRWELHPAHQPVSIRRHDHPSATRDERQRSMEDCRQQGDSGQQRRTLLHDAVSKDWKVQASRQVLPCPFGWVNYGARAVVFRTNYYLYQSCQLLLFLHQYAHWITCFRCVSVEMCAKVQLPPISGFWPLPVLPAVLSRHLSVAIKL